MSQKKYIKGLRRKGINLFIICAFMSVISVTEFIRLINNPDVPVRASCFLGVGSIAFIIFMLFSIDYIIGEKSLYIRKHGNKLILAEDLEKNLQYEDDFIMVSGKAVGFKNDATAIVEREKVKKVYEKIDRSNGVVTSRYIVVKCENEYPIRLNVFLKKHETIDDIILTILHFCPNATNGN